MGLHLHEKISYIVVPVGHVPAECIARVVGHDQTILYERPLQVAPYALAIQDHFHASGDRSLGQDQQQKRLDLDWNSATEMSVEKNNVERNIGAGNDSLKRFAVVNNDKRANKAPQSRRYRVP